MSAKVISNETVISGINGWAWAKATSLISPDGTRIEAVPAIQSVKGSPAAPRLQFVAQKSGNGMTALLNIRAGWSPELKEGKATAPATLLAAAGQIDANNPQATNAAFLALKNRHQIVLSFNTSLESHQEALAKLCPAWKTATAGQSVVIARGRVLDIQGLRFASDADGKLIFDQNGSPLYNWSQIDVSVSTLDQELEASSSTTGGARSIDQSAAMAALGISVQMDDAFKVADPAAPASRADAPPMESPAEFGKAVRAAGYTVTIPQANKLIAAGYDSASLIEELKADPTATVAAVVTAVAA